MNEDCIIVVELPDRALTQQRALTVMRELALLYPAAAHRTTSVYDAHVDHRTLARALYALAQEYRKNGVELDIGFYRVYIYKTPSTRRAAKANVKAVPVVDPDVKRQALAEFFMWDPAAGRFAIGGSRCPNYSAKPPPTRTSISTTFLSRPLPGSCAGVTSGLRSITPA